MKPSGLVCFLMAMLMPLSLHARDYSQIYSANTLRSANNTYSTNIHAVLYEDIRGYLLPREIRVLDRTELKQPWNRTQDPFEFSAYPDRGVILIPTLSIKFFDDLAIALSWYERFGCNKESVFDYVASLDFGEGSVQPPLTALGVPDKAYELDDYVDDVSQKTLKSAIVFLLLHELGHVYHQHQGYDGISSSQAQGQEAEADAFAMKVLRRMHLPPLGMTAWFLAISMRDPAKPGSPRQTHPMTADRLKAIADELRQNPDDFIEPENRGIWNADTIRTLADNIEVIGRGVSDPDLRQLLRERGRRATPELLAGGCQAEQHQQDWMDLFR